MSRTMERRVQHGAASRNDSERLEPYYRLVELQKEIIEVVRQKAETERQCALLRERLAREAEQLRQSRRSRWIPARTAMMEFLQRLFRNRPVRHKSPRPNTSAAISKDGKNWDCLWSIPQPTQE